MPYLSTELRPQGELLSGYSLLDDTPLPNEIAAISGQAPTAKTKAGCPKFDDCVFPVETTTIADQLSVGRFTWRAYMEGMTDPATGEPGNCVYPGGRRTVPAGRRRLHGHPQPVRLLPLAARPRRLRANDLPLTALDADLRKADATANLSFIAPTLCNAGSTVECPEGQTGGPAAADAFLAAVGAEDPRLARLQEGRPADRHLRLARPGAADAGAPPPPAASRKVGTLLLSRFLSPGATDAKPYDPYSLLRSTEDTLRPLAPRRRRRQEGQAVRLDDPAQGRDRRLAAAQGSSARKSPISGPK